MGLGEGSMMASNLWHLSLSDVFNCVFAFNNKKLLE